MGSIASALRHHVGLYRAAYEGTDLPVATDSSHTLPRMQAKKGYVGLSRVILRRGIVSFPRPRSSRITLDLGASFLANHNEAFAMSRDLRTDAQAPQNSCVHCLATLRPVAWASDFRARKATFETSLLPLPPGFQAYLKADGLVLPEAPADVPLSKQDPRWQHSSRLPPLGGCAEGEAADASDSEDDAPPTPTFPELERALATAIEALGGAAFMKLEWTAPVDAAWIAVDGSLRVTTPGHAYSLLKASEMAAHSLDLVRHVLTSGAARCDTAGAAAGCGSAEAGSAGASTVDEGCKGVGTTEHAAATAVSTVAKCTTASASSDTDATHQPHLVLRPWFDLHASREFRCFIDGGRCIAACVRHTDAPFPYSGAEAAEMREQLAAFLHAKVIGRFPLRRYTCDVYLDRKGRGWVLDFGLLAAGRDTGLFTPAELGLLSPALADADGAPATGALGAEGGSAGAAVTEAATAGDKAAVGFGAASRPRSCDCCTSVGAAPVSDAAPAAGAAPSVGGSAELSAGMLWRTRAGDETDSESSETGDDAADSAAGAAAAGAAGPAVSFPRAAANQYPDELLMLCSATGRSLADVIGDMEGALKAAALAGVDCARAFQMAGEDSGSDSDSASDSGSDE